MSERAAPVDRDEQPTRRNIMMNTDSRWRHDLARAIAERYVGRNRLRPILPGGSTAQGNADPWSDIDLVLSWGSGLTRSGLIASQCRGMASEESPDARRYRENSFWSSTWSAISRSIWDTSPFRGGMRS